jgi:hypothetical protein
MSDNQKPSVVHKILIADDHQVIVKVLPFRLETSALEELRAIDESWTVTGLVLKCSVCNGSGKAQDNKNNCGQCNGHGWKRVGQVPP